MVVKIEVDASQIKVTPKLQSEIQNCKICREARLCFAYCCSFHFKKIKDYVTKVEAKGLFVELKGKNNVSISTNLH